MKISMVIATTGAAVVLAVPAAHAVSGNAVPVGSAANRHVHHAAGAHRSKARGVTPVAAKARKRIGRIAAKPVAGRPIYIYIPAPPIGTVAPAPADPNECQDTGNNCNPQQLCEFWGENCPAPPVATTATDGSVTDPSVGEGSPQ